MAADQTIEAGRDAGVIQERSAEAVIVDTTVMEKAIAHPTRLAILRILLHEQDCICGRIVSVLGQPQSTVSQHLKVLKDAELICGESDGTSMCYCLDPETYRRFRVLLTDVV